MLNTRNNHPIPQCIDCGLDRKDYSALRCKHCELERASSEEDDYRYRNQLPPYALAEGEEEEYDRTHPRKRSVDEVTCADCGQQHVVTTDSEGLLLRIGKCAADPR